MNNYFYYITQALDNLKRNPSFSLNVIVTMGVVLGFLLCVLTLSFVVFIKPLPHAPFNSLQEIKTLRAYDSSGVQNVSGFSFPGAVYLYQNQSIFEEVALFHQTDEIASSLPHQPDLTTSYVSYEWLNMIEVPMNAGRQFADTEKNNSFNPVAIVSYQTWQNQFSGAEDILDKKITIDTTSFNIIGVTSKDFHQAKLGRSKTDIWLPWDFNSMKSERWHRGTGISIFARNKTSSLTALNNHITSTDFENKWMEENENIQVNKIGLVVQSVKKQLVGNKADRIYYMLVAVFGIVFIAVANVTNLMTAQLLKTRKKLAVSVSLGAKRLNVFQEQFYNYVLLMSLSLFLALVVSATGFNVIGRYAPLLFPRIEELSNNYFTFISALFLVFSFAILFSLPSFKKKNFNNVLMELKSGSKGGDVQASTNRRNLIILTQVSVTAMMVFIGSGIFYASLTKIQQPMGYNPENVIGVAVRVSSNFVMDEEQSQIMMREIRTKLLLEPAIEAVSMTSSPLDNIGLQTVDYQVSDTKNQSRQLKVVKNRYLEMKRVDDTYFSVLGQKLIAGRYFNENDSFDTNENDPFGTSNGIIINDIFAREIDADLEVIGKKISINNKKYLEIIGIVQSATFVFDEQSFKRYYLPSPYRKVNDGFFMMLKLSKNQHYTEQKLRHLFKQVNPALNPYRFQSINETRAEVLFPYYLTAYTTLASVIVSLFLAAVGLYGILSFSINIRRFELGIRLAIGAKRVQIFRLVIIDNLVPFLMGIGGAVLVLLAIYSYFPSVLAPLFKNNLLIIVLFTLCSILLILTMACYIPIRKIINNPVSCSLNSAE